jgi:hypothetical protein
LTAVLNNDSPYLFSGFQQHRAGCRMVGETKTKPALAVRLFCETVIKGDWRVRLVDFAGHPKVALTDSGLANHKFSSCRMDGAEQERLGQDARL